MRHARPVASQAAAIKAYVRMREPPSALLKIVPNSAQSSTADEETQATIKRRVNSGPRSTEYFGGVPAQSEA